MMNRMINVLAGLAVCFLLFSRVALVCGQGFVRPSDSELRAKEEAQHRQYEREKERRAEELEKRKQERRAREDAQSAADRERWAVEAIPSHSPPELHAAAAGDLEQLKQLLAIGADVKSLDLANHWTALHYACYAGDVAAVQLLLEHGADVNAATFKARITPLFLAAARSPDVVRMLLKKGASVDFGGPVGSAVHSAVYARRADVLAVLVEAGAKMILTDADGMTPLHIAEMSEQVRALLEAGASVNARASDGSTPLHCAARRRDVEAVQYLLANGADPNAKDSYGMTPEARSCVIAKYSSAVEDERLATIRALLVGFGSKSPVVDSSRTETLVSFTPITLSDRKLIVSKYRVTRRGSTAATKPTSRGSEDVSGIPR